MQMYDPDKNRTRSPISRPGFGLKGQKIALCTNHFKVNLSKDEGYFFHYFVSLYNEDGSAFDGKGIGRKIMEKLHETYAKNELANKDFAYDGENALFTLGALPRKELELTVVLDKVSCHRSFPGGSKSCSEGGQKKRKCVSQTKTFLVQISYATKIPIRAISDALRGKVSDECCEAIRVLDIVLRQHAAKQGCLIVRQSFFHNDPRNFTDIGGGVLGCRGLHSSFCATQNGLTLNMDGSFTTIFKPGPVLDFLVARQNLKHHSQIDWSKAKCALKNLRVKTAPSNAERKITGLSKELCKNQSCAHWFLYKGIESSRRKPLDKMRILKEARKSNDYAAEGILRSCGITIDSAFTQLEGCVLAPPKLKVGGGKEIVPRDGRWNFNGKTLAEPTSVLNWVMVNFSACCDARSFCIDMARVGKMMGINVEPPICIVEENPQFRRAPPALRVEKMFEQLSKQLVPFKVHLNKNNDKKCPNFILCFLPDKKINEIYGPWKRKTLTELGIPNQCIATTRTHTLCITNLLLKINAKLGGLHTLLANEKNIPMFSKKPTVILGMDVLHGSHYGVPSISAVASSRCWPSISRYRASVRSQWPQVQVIDSLYKPLVGSVNGDEGIIRELLVEFYASSGKVKPSQVIIFRHGISKSQFKQVLNVEFQQILEACELLDSDWHPKFTIIIDHRNHHTKFFQSDKPHQNIPPGTVVDNKVCHPTYYDFYMCPHAGLIGTSRPIHYHVLLDEIGFSPDDLQEFVHSLSYVSQKSTSAISTVSPIRYANLAARQWSQCWNYEGSTSETYAGHANGEVPDQPKLHKEIRESMFFC